MPRSVTERSRPPRPMSLEKIVSGGQTGVDRGALEAALTRGLPCGGWCPDGRRAEDGAIPLRYPVHELPAAGYHERTLQNVLDSDGTAIFGFGPLAGGTALTREFCLEHHKPHVLIDGSRESPKRAAEILASFLEKHSIRVLNVAGPRASHAPQASAYAEEAIGLLIDEAAQ